MIACVAQELEGVIKILTDIFLTNSMFLLFAGTTEMSDWSFMDVQTVEG